jgi:hypothetical protein
MIADHRIPNGESAKLNFPPYLLILQDLLLHAWRNTSIGVYLNAQKRLAVFAVRWQQHEQCLSAQFQWRLALRGKLQEIAWLLTFD